MHEIHDLIRQYGDLFYLITFLWTALEGETFVIFAGLLAQKGAPNIWLLFLASWLGSMCGDQICFLIGRKIGPKILDHLPRMKPGVERAIGWLEDYAVVFILSYRFMYGIRNVSGIAIGLSHVPWKKFAIWNAVAAFLWAAAFVGAGYLYGDVIQHMSHHHGEEVQTSVREIMLSILGLFAVILIVRYAIVHWRQRRAKRHKT